MKIAAIAALLLSLSFGLVAPALAEQATASTITVEQIAAQLYRPHAPAASAVTKVGGSCATACGAGPEGSCTKSCSGSQSCSAACAGGKAVCTCE